MLSSKNNGHPLFSGEALSAGSAIVASDTAPLPEAIRHDETGRLVDFFDVAEGVGRGQCPERVQECGEIILRESDRFVGLHD